jgi:hypothetical protein
MQERCLQGTPPDPAERMADATAHLYRKFLVIAEDSDLGAALGKQIEAHGCLVAGPFRRSGPALEFISGDCADLALIDSLSADPRLHELTIQLADDTVPQIFFNGFDHDRGVVRVEEDGNPGFCRDLTVPELLETLDRNVQADRAAA